MYSQRKKPITISATQAKYKKSAYMAKPKAKKSVYAPAAKVKARTNYNQKVKKSPYAGIGSALGSALGSAGAAAFGIPPQVGAAVGGMFGELGQSLIKSVTGFGDYTFNKNSIVNSDDQVPMIRNGRPTHIITHREFISDIKSGTAGSFSINKFPIQPGLANSFPWLNSIAQQYSQYIVHGMIFEFKSTSSDALNSTNTALGSVNMAVQYNANDIDPVNKQQMENLAFSTSGKPSQSFMMGVECAYNQTQQPILNVRVGGTTASNTDLRFFDMGNMYISVSGMQAANVTVGELYVTYQIEFMKEKMGNSPDLVAHYQLGGTISNTAPWGTPSLSSTSNFRGIELDNATATITFPLDFTGNVIVVYQILNTNSNASAPPTWTFSGGASSFNQLNLNTTSQYTSAQSGLITYSVLFAKIVNGGVLTAGGINLAATPIRGDLHITTLPLTLSD